MASIETGIFIRVKLDDRWQTVDIGDPRMPASVMLRWLIELPDDEIARTIAIVREAVRLEDPLR